MPRRRLLGVALPARILRHVLQRTQLLYDCYLTEIQAACCDERGTNCPATSDVPNTCPVGCAVVFPAFLETCRSHVAEHAPTSPTMTAADFEAFEHLCLTSDGLALVSTRALRHCSGFLARF